MSKELLHSSADISPRFSLLAAIRANNENNFLNNAGLPDNPSLIHENLALLLQNWDLDPKALSDHLRIMRNQSPIQQMEYIVTHITRGAQHCEVVPALPFAFDQEQCLQTLIKQHPTLDNEADRLLLASFLSLLAEFIRAPIIRDGFDQKYGVSEFTPGANNQQKANDTRPTTRLGWRRAMTIVFGLPFDKFIKNNKLRQGMINNVGSAIDMLDILGVDIFAPAITAQLKSIRTACLINDAEYSAMSREEKERIVTEINTSLRNCLNQIAEKIPADQQLDITVANN